MNEEGNLEGDYPDEQCDQEVMVMLGRTVEPGSDRGCHSNPTN